MVPGGIEPRKLKKKPTTTDWIIGAATPEASYNVAPGSKTENPREKSCI